MTRRRLSHFVSYSSTKLSLISPLPCEDGQILSIVALMAGQSTLGLFAVPATGAHGHMLRFGAKAITHIGRPKHRQGGCYSTNVSVDNLYRAVLIFITALI